MIEDGTFPLCNVGLQTGIHTFCDCTIAKAIRQIVVPRHDQLIFFSLPLKDWVVWNLQDKGSLNCGEVEWKTLFGVLCWQLWKNRNATLFSNSNRNI